MHIEKGKRKSLHQQPYRLDEKYVDLILLWTFLFKLKTEKRWLKMCDLHHIIQSYQEWVTGYSDLGQLSFQIKLAVNSRSP